MFGYHARTADMSVYSCKKCKGSKTTRQKKAVTVLVERGARTGDRIVLRGEGEEYVSVQMDRCYRLLKTC